MKNIFLLLLVIPQFLFCQKNKLSLFDNLVGKTWQAEGEWMNGSPFKQEITYRYSLDKKLIIAETKGFLDKDKKVFGQRNHGIRKYDKTSNEIQFWEFDILGDLTEGTVSSMGNDVLYKYSYGGTNVTDYWKYENDSTYKLTIGVFENGEWKQTFSSVEFTAVNIPAADQMYLTLKDKLIGEWESEAWDGILYESWKLDENGHIHQRAEYIENQQVLYKSENKIEIVNDEIILFTVIDGNNPKIFKATSYDADKIVFENSDYKNPSKVVYNFNNKNEFERTISGIENENPSNYTFHFKPKK